MRTPYAAPIDSRFIAAAFTGTTIERNIIASSSTDTATTKPTTSHTRPDRISERSANSGVRPVTSTPSGSSARRSSTRSEVRSSAGPNVGLRLEDGERAVRGRERGGDPHDPGRRLDLCGHGGRVGLGRLDDDRERSVRAVAVLRRDQVVGLTHGGVGAVAAAVLRPRAHAQGGGGEQQQEGEGGQGRGDRSLGDAGRPAGGQRLLLGTRHAVLGALRTLRGCSR